MPKTKGKCLPLHEKAKIVEEFNRGMTVTALSRKYGVAKSTICSIKKKRKKICERVANALKPTKQCTLKTAEHPDLEHRLYRWFLAQREKNMPVSGEMIKQKALNLKTVMNIENFSASDGWLQRFKTRYGIRFLKITGEKLSSQTELVDPFKKKLMQMIHEFDLNEHQLYNADETGLYWQLLPDKTYVSLTEKVAPGMKTAKQRITFLGCTNTSGLHKLKPLVIGKAKNPRCFKNFVNPLVYRHTKNAWMTAEIFRNWFFQQFVPEVRIFLRNQGLPERAVLLLDNAPSHPPAHELKTNDSMIFVMFMPPNVTPLIQPMDQNVLRLTKLYYRNSLLSSIVKTDEPIGVALKKLTLKDAMMNLAAAWEKLDPTIISKCWKNIMTESKEDEDDLPLSVLQQRWNTTADAVVMDTITLLQAIEPVEYSTQDVEEWNKDRVKDHNFPEESDDGAKSDSDSDFTDVVQPKISHADAVQALKISVEWAEQNGLDISDILRLKAVQEKAIMANISIKKVQTKITTYFHGS